MNNWKIVHKKLYILSICMILFISNIAYVAYAYDDRELEYKSSVVGGKKGHVNVAKIFDSYDRTKELDKALGAKSAEMDKEREILVKEIKQIKDEAPYLSASARAEKQIILDKKIEALKEYDRTGTAWLTAARDTMVKELLKDLEAEIKLLGDAEGYEFIVNSQAGKDGKDLTSQIIRNLNKKYKDSKTKTKKATINGHSDSVQVNKGDDTITQLERLASLKEKGVITEEEFQSQKKKILAHQ
jgi:Skp family chaperone for outer membrane proteins